MLSRVCQKGSRSGLRSSANLVPGDHTARPVDRALTAGRAPGMSGRLANVPGMTLDEICDNVHQLADRHGWDQTDSAARILHVTAEVGEVADALISLRAASSDQAEAARTALGHEIFDAIWNLCALANATGIDIAQAGSAKMALNAERSWPEDRI